MTLTTSQILQCIAETPGITTQELAHAGCSEDGAPYMRAYHCTRVKVASLKRRGQIHRAEEHKPGRQAHWYLGEGNE